MAVTKLFGNSIAPSCEYCSHNNASDGIPVCFYGYSTEEDDCTFFNYDPLMRKPKVLPPLKTYSEEDFSL